MRRSVVYPNRAFLTIFSLYNDSHMPCKFAVQVPETTKLSVNTGAPIKSIPERNGVPSSFRPATTGSQNHGPNLTEFSMILALSECYKMNVM